MGSAGGVSDWGGGGWGGHAQEAGRGGGDGGVRNGDG